MIDSFPNVEEDPINYWRYHSKTWQTSGLTQPEYCTKFSVNYASFIYQHAKILKQAKTKVNFIEAKAIKGSNITASGIQLILPNGVRVAITNAINDDLLRKVLTIAGDI